MSCADLRVRTAGELLDTIFPPREPLLEGLLKTGESAMLWAASGVGKTWAALSVAAAVAGGGRFLSFPAPAARRVLYVDGEMHRVDLQERLGALVAGAEGLNLEALRANLCVMARQDQDADLEFPDLASPEGQAEVFRLARTLRAELVILDNFSTLANVTDENAASAMDPVLAFLLRLKQAGIATILVHHSGKSGESYRGSSKLEATFEVVAGLKRTTVSANGVAGAAFDLTFTKFRGKRTEAHAETTAWLEEAPGGGLRWASRRSETDVLNQMIAAARTLEFPTQLALAKHLGLSKSELSRKKDKAVALGLISEADWKGLLRAAAGLGSQDHDLTDDTEESAAETDF